MPQKHSLTFTNKTGLFSSKRRIFLTIGTFALFLAIIGICGYQLKYGEVGTVWIGEQGNLALDKLDSYRLPKNLKPIYYKLDLIPYPSPQHNFTIDGVVQIHLQCDKGTDKITLNIKNITINEKSVQVWELEDGQNGTRPLDVIGHSYDPTKDFYTITLNETLVEGSYYGIYISYTAILNDQLVGFYRSSYIDTASNQTRWLGVTQFSPTDARRAFPSFDEPAFKAEFEVSLARMQNMTTLSNMNLNKTEAIEDMPNWFWDHYAKSVPMSSYLVGFAVTDFAHVVSSNKSLSEPVFKIWARPEAINQTAYAGDIGPRILSYFEKYFGIDFPLPKQDMMGVPDHRFNAMENWGMITYRELAILYDPNYSSDVQKRRIAEVVSHELAHQWFGNLVTPRWWSDLWLKEGFASYVQYLGVDYVEPEWEMLDLFVVKEIQTVFRLDALNNSHPISVPVGHPDEINRIFDDISYSKGCSIIRMMDHFLTPATFRKGLTNYLNKWKFNNTDQNDLWDSLTLQAHEDGTLHPAMTVGKIMDTWTLQKGFPVVNVTRNYTTGIVTLNQKKFSLIPEYENSGYRWHIPISYGTRSNSSNFKITSPQFWIFDNQTQIETDLSQDLKPDDWLIVNIQTTGYYRVNYDADNWMMIINQLNDEADRIHIVNRAQLIDDAMTLARASLMPYDLALNLTLYLVNEHEYLPWESYFNGLSHLVNMLQDSMAYENLKSYAASLLAEEYNQLGFEERANDSVLVKGHRANIIKWACAFDHSDCVQKSVKLFRDWMNMPSNNLIPVNLRSTIYCTAIRNGSYIEWEFAKSEYSRVNVASEKDRILSALACSKNETIITSYLNDAVTPNSFVRKQDSRNVLQRVGSQNEVGNRLAFELLQKEWPRISQYFGAGLSISRLINEGIAIKLNTEDDLVAIEKFKENYEGQFGFGERSVDEAIEITRTNVHWMKKSYKDVADWLETQTNEPPTTTQLPIEIEEVES